LTLVSSAYEELYKILLTETDEQYRPSSKLMKFDPDGVVCLLELLCYKPLTPTGSYFGRCFNLNNLALKGFLAGSTIYEATGWHLFGVTKKMLVNRG